jgi:predicted transcriptional regulator
VNHTRIAQLEMDCMKVLWERAGASVAEVRAALPRPLAYTTVMTVLDRMSAKGVVARQKKGRAYIYSPVLDRDAARSEAVRELLTNLFGDDPKALIQYLASPQAAAVPVSSATGGS